MDRHRVAKSHPSHVTFSFQVFFYGILCQKKNFLVRAIFLVSAEQKELKSKTASQQINQLQVTLLQ
jgi:hypothetical protein